MDATQTLESLQALGFTLPTPAYLFGMILFSIFGYVAWRYGRKNSRKYVKWLGVALMLYPYVVSSTWLMYAVGVGLCAACYYFRDRS
jgi:MFS family permease